MTVSKDKSGRRSVSAEVEVPGTPEAVWQAIATGPGISSWFVPAEVDGRVGGKTVCHFGPDPGMKSVATITDWQPPHRFAAESDGGSGPIATEWIVEAKAGGTCTVRVVHSWFAEGEDRDAQFEGHAEGWQAFFRILQVYLEHFPGEASRIVQLTGQASDPLPAVFDRLIGPLGVGHDRVRPAAGVPPLAGDVLEMRHTAEGFSVILRLDSPGRAIAHLIGFPMGGPVCVSVRFYLYGAAAIALADEIEAAWSTWLAARLPARA